MPLVATRALVLQAFPYSDTSKILRFFTLTHGLCSALAKGAQRPRSRFGGLLELFTEGEALLYVKEGRELHTLSGFDLLRSRQSLGRDLTAFAGASLIAELLLRFATEEPHPQLFRTACHSLDAIASSGHDRAEMVVVASAWRVISQLGYRPETDTCVTCQRLLTPDEGVRFDPQGGGAACTQCRPSGRTLDAQSRQELRSMLLGKNLSAVPARPALHRALLGSFLSAHLSPDRPLRSLELFLHQLV